MGISSKNNGLSLGSTPSHGNPTSTSALNTELNNVARNTDDIAKARALVEAGADLSSTNGPTWRHTPLHQAAFHGRYNMAACLVELGAPLQLRSNPCGRGAAGTPLELARGGGHKRIAEMIERAIRAGGRDAKRAAGADGGANIVRTNATFLRENAWGPQKLSADGLTVINGGPAHESYHWSCHQVVPAITPDVVRASITFKVLTNDHSGSNGIYFGLTPADHFKKQGDIVSHGRHHPVRPMAACGASSSYVYRCRDGFKRVGGKWSEFGPHCNQGNRFTDIGVYGDLKLDSIHHVKLKAKIMHVKLEYDRDCKSLRVFDDRSGAGNFTECSAQPLSDDLPVSEMHSTPLYFFCDTCTGGQGATIEDFSMTTELKRPLQAVQAVTPVAVKRAASADGGSIAEGRWEVYHNIDMCFQGDAEIIHDWKRHTSIAKLKKTVEEKNYSAVCVGSFGHAALKSFDYQLTKEHCKPSQGYTNELHIWFPSGKNAKREMMPAPRPTLPAGFCFHDGFGEASRGDQIGHITSGGVEGHCFKGDKMNWPLQWAAMIGDLKAIETLVAAGHDPNAKMTDWYDSEPLGWAASFGQCKAIVALCEAGADPSRPANLAGNTPLSDAQREGHEKAIELINQYLSKAPRTLLERPFAVSSTGHGGAAEGDKALLDGHYFSFQTGGDPRHVVDRFEVRQAGNRVTYYRNGHVGSTGRVDPATAHACESYEIRGDQLIGLVTATVQKSGDITYSHGYTSRKEDVSATGQRELMAKSAGGGAALDSYGSDFDGSLAEPLAHAAWNGNLGHVRSLLDRGAPPNTEAHNGFSNGHHSALNGASRNGHAAIVKLLLEQPVKPDIEGRCQDPWAVTPLQQAAYHGRAECAKILLEHGASTTSRSGPGCNNKTAKEIAKAMRNAEWQELVAAIDAHSELTLKRAARRISAPTAQKNQRTSFSLGSDAWDASAPSPRGRNGTPNRRNGTPPLRGASPRPLAGNDMADDGERPLVETVDVLRRELALKGTVAQVVKQACAQLGVDTIGNALTQQANECWEIVMGK